MSKFGCEERCLAVGHVNLSRACLLSVALDEGKLNYHANDRTKRAHRRNDLGEVSHFKCQFDWDFICLPNVGERYLRVLAEIQEVH